MYKLLENTNCIMRLSDLVAIPKDTDNSDYRAYLGWLAEGNIPLPADPLPSPVLTATKLKFRRALNQLNLRDQVEAAVAAADQNTKDAWLLADYYVSSDPLVLALGQALGKTEAEIRVVFELANSYPD